MKLIVPTAKRLSIPTGKRLTLPHGYMPTIRNGLLWASPLLEGDARSIYDSGIVSYVDPESEDIDADGTYIDSDGILQQAILDVARIESDGYRQEATDSNVIIQSKNFDAVWSKVQGVAVTPNTDVAPDGTTTADTITDDSSNFEHLLQDVTIADDSTWWSGSIHILKDNDETRFPELQLLVQGGTAQLIFVQINTKTGATAVRSSTGTVNYYVEDKGNYWRLTVSVLNNSTGNTTLRTTIFPARGTTLGGSSAATTGSIIVWGFQAENAKFSSSYIPTTDSSVTRTADYLRYPATGNISGTACTIAMAITPHLSGTANGSGRWFRWRAAHWIDCYINNGKWAVNLKDAGANIDLISTTTLLAGRRDVLILTHDGTELEQKMYVNGVKEGPTRTKGLMTSVSTLMSIGSTSPNNSVLPGNYAHARIYDRALSAVEALAVTNEINGWMD